MNILFFCAGIILLFAGIFNLISAYIVYPLFLKYKSKKKTAHKNNNIKSVEITKKFSFAIIIPFYNENSVLIEKLNTIPLNFIIDTNSEIIIINDGNINFNLDKLKKNITNQNLLKYTKFYKLSKHRGKSFALYISAKSTNADYLIFTDSNSKFKNDYFENLQKILNTENLELFGGLLDYENKIDCELSEKKYWNYETSLKLTEQDAGLFNTGLFGSNIIIKKNVYLTYPYYCFCDFSLPLYYQSANNKKINLEDSLIVYENPPDNSFSEIFKIKKRIIHRAFYGLLKYLKFKKINNVLLDQLYFHKISRWLTPYWLLFILIGCYSIFGNFTIYIFLSGCLLIIALSKILRVNIKYIASVNLAAFCAVISFFIKPSLDKWLPSPKK